jgi:hypothetical protein
MYCGLPAKKVFAKKVISGGAIIQLAIIVTRSGLGFRTAFLMSLNWIPTTVGYIMKNSNIPIGIDNEAYFNESINSPKPGKNLPTSKPTTMQIAIQKVRYFSQSPKDNSFFACSSLVSKLFNLLAASYVFKNLLRKNFEKFRSQSINDIVHPGIHD